jgi:gamma-glutamylcysteine synthetase
MKLSEQVKQAFFDYINHNYRVPNYLLVSPDIYKTLLEEHSNFITTTLMDTGMEDMKFLECEIGVTSNDDSSFEWKKK